jgi:single-strand DNA-binding protein
MSKSLNKVQLIGRLGGDPEMKYTQAGMARTTFSLATDRAWQDKEGNLREETDWHSVVAWDKLAQTCAEYLSKGRLVYIEGRLQTRAWEFEGKTGNKTEIVALNMLILDSKSNGVAEAAPEQDYARSEVQPRGSSQRQPAELAAVAPAPRPAAGKQGRTLVLEPEDDPEDLPF